MNKKILLGTELFDEFISGNGYYVDKTELIYELVEEAANKVTLFTRPRRFGKTLTMSMMECFFSIQKGDSRALFEGKNIMRHSDFCNTWMNKYPILSPLSKCSGQRFQIFAQKTSSLRTMRK